MMNMVLITLQADAFYADFELPADIKLHALYPRLLQALKAENPHQFERFTAIILEKEGAGLLDEDANLLDYGIRSGDYLDVVRKEKYDGFRKR